MKRKRPPEEIIKKLREAATLLAGGQGVRKLEVSPPTLPQMAAGIWRG